MKRIRFTGCDCEVVPGACNVNDLPFNCKATWALVASGHTTGIFQLEKKLGQDWARRIKPNSADELSDVLALLRPGPLEAEMTADYNRVKDGRLVPSYLHPVLKPIFEATKGVMVYQEQAIRVAVDVAGFTPVEADDLRRAIGKKKVELMAQIKALFMKKAAAKGLVPPDTAEEIFGWIEKCQSYSFNKSHSMSYAMIAYQTAWCKAHFPVEFYAAYLTFSAYKAKPKEAVYELVQDARLFGVTILPPDIRRCNPHFTIFDDPEQGRCVAFGLSHVRKVGEKAIGKIVESGPEAVATWPKFLVSVPALHRDVGEALIRSGACDGFGLSRARMLRELQFCLGTAGRSADGKKVDSKGLSTKELEYFKAHYTGKIALAQFIEHMIDPTTKGACRTAARRQVLQDKLPELNVPQEDLPAVKAAAEKHYIGVSLSCSAADLADDSLATHTCLDAAREANEVSMSICCVIDAVRHTKTKRGRNPGAPMCFLTVSDSTLSYDMLVVFPDKYQRLKENCKPDLVVLVTGAKRDGSFIVEDVQVLM